MTVSVFELFSIGIGPSSSHTVGPMRAAQRFVADLADRGLLVEPIRVEAELFGSLAATGAGQGTLDAVLLGLEGLRPETISTDTKQQRLAWMAVHRRIRIGGLIEIPFTTDDIVCRANTYLPEHPNAMTLRAFGIDPAPSAEETYLSVGGGFVVTASEWAAASSRGPAADTVPCPYSDARELLELCASSGCSIADITLANEAVHRSRDDVAKYLLEIADVMHECARRGMRTDGVLPGGLNVKRRAKVWWQRLVYEDPDRAPEFAEDWVNLVALAVNEENAAGGRVVTAPTNGAAGIVPAVLYYARRYTSAGRADHDDATVRFLLTAGAVGALIKEHASISGADVGCQGEVGSAAAMAAAGLAEVLGGSPAQVENAAEIAMEHSLGLTCDPIGGLVQIPCIERNAISAGRAINAARMALRGDGTHRVSLDQVIATMRDTGRDMHSKYKETATGGLAVHVPLNIVEC